MPQGCPGARRRSLGGESVWYPAVHGDEISRNARVPEWTIYPAIDVLFQSNLLNEDGELCFLRAVTVEWSPSPSSWMSPSTAVATPLSVPRNWPNAPAWCAA